MTGTDNSYKKMPFLHKVMYEEYDILCSLEQQIPQDRIPLDEEEHFALLLYRWLKAQAGYDTLLENFEEAYEKGLIASFIDIDEKLDDEEWEHIVEDLRGEFIGLSALNGLGRKCSVPLWKAMQLLLDGKKRLSKEEYKTLLFLKYCYNFWYWEKTDFKGSDFMILCGVRLLKTAMKDDYLLQEARSRVKSTLKKTFDEDDYKVIAHRSSLRGNFNNLKNFFNDFFFINDIDLDYSVWKENIAGDANFKGHLLHSLYIRLHNRAEYFNLSKDAFRLGTPDYERVRQIITSLYYWHYGLVEGHYADLLFDIIHSDKITVKKKTLIRLLSLKQDIAVHNFLQKKYVDYCRRNKIPKEREFPVLSSCIYYKLPEGFLSGKAGQDENDYFNDVNLTVREKIQQLFESLVDNRFIENTENILLVLAYRFTGMSKPSPCEPIVWHGTKNDLFYLVKQLAPDSSKIWKKTESFFVDKEKNAINMKGAAQMCKQNFSDDIKNICEQILG